LPITLKYTPSASDPQFPLAIDCGVNPVLNLDAAGEIAQTESAAFPNTFPAKRYSEYCAR